MSIKNIKEGYIIQKNVFEDMNHEFEENLELLFAFIEEELSKVDELVQETLRAPKDLTFSEDLASILIKGTYGEDYIITGFDRKNDIFELTLMDIDNNYNCTLKLPFGLDAKKEISLKDYEDLILELAQEEITGFYRE